MTAAVIADDFTGAHEMGALLADAGLRVHVAAAWESPCDLDGDAWVFNTESRHLPPKQAAARVRSVTSALLALGVERFYKKTDSTLRGPIAAELAAFSDVLADRPVVYVPAYPRLGRTVVNGELLVDGNVVTATAFGRDLLNPVTESSVPEMLRQGGCEQVQLAPDVQRLRSGVIYVFDGVTELDLEEIAKALDPSSVAAAGPGGFGRYWARSIGSARYRPNLPKVRSALLVSGSRHPMARRQVELAGIPAIQAPEELQNEPKLVAQELAHMLAADERPELLIVFGGDTAVEVLRQLGVDNLRPAGEVLPGIPISWCGDMLIVTKAGGFGEPDVVQQIMRVLA